MRRLVLVCAFAIAAVSCTSNPTATKTSSNPDVAVELLFEHEGVRMYRFYDGGRSHYYAVPISGWSVTLGPQSCGKNCTRQVEIPLVAQQ